MDVRSVQRTSSAAAPAGGRGDPARARQIELILERIETIPTLSTVGTRLLQLGSARDVKIDDVVKILETDPALSAKMLSLCRRADKGIREPIRTVKRAVLMLGFESVRAVALSVCVYDLLSSDAVASRGVDEAVAAGASAGHDDDQGPAFDRTGYWKHLVAVACASELLARSHPSLKIVPEEAFLAGLLHGVGRLVLDHVLPRSYDKVVRLAQRRGCASAAVERPLIGIDHHTAGRRIAEHWGLPEPVRDVIWLHGQSASGVPETADRGLLALVNCARGLCRLLHMGWSGDFGELPDIEGLWSDMGVRARAAEEFAEPLHAAVADRLGTLGLEEATPPSLLAESLANANRELARLNESLRERASLGEGHARALGLLREFIASDALSRRVTDAADAIAASARATLGAVFVAILLPADPARGWSWRLLSESAAAGVGGGRGMSSYPIEEPPGGTRAAAGLQAVSNGRVAMSVATLGLGPWLADHVAHGPDMRSLRLLPMPAVGVRGAPAGKSAAPAREADPVPILVIDAEPANSGLSPASLEPLLLAWSAALAGSRRIEQSQRQAEGLAEANRVLQETRAALSQQESLARLGEMAAGAAHEMNNPLAVISGRAQLLARRFGDTKDHAALTQIADAARQLSELVAELHTMTTRQNGEPRPVLLREVVDGVIAAAGKRVDAAPPVRVDVAGVPAQVSVDPSMFAAALEELIVNAMQACPRGPVQLTAEIDALDGRLLVTVRDAGPGMSPKAMKHAFDAFFSERPAGRGRGLGLTRARRLARSMGGDVALHSVPGKGTTATMFLQHWQVEERREAA